MRKAELFRPEGPGAPFWAKPKAVGHFGPGIPLVWKSRILSLIEGWLLIGRIADPDPGPKGPRTGEPRTRASSNRGGYWPGQYSHPSKSLSSYAIKGLGRDPRFRPSKEGLHRQIIEATREGPAGRRLVSYGVAFHLEILL